MDKAPDAFRTISEVADDLDIPQHVLRFWETRFSQIKPMKRSGGRRYYRPDDVDLLRGIRRLLYGEGYTIRGVQRILKENGIKAVQGLVGSAAAPGLSPIRSEPVLRAPAPERDEPEPEEEEVVEELDEELEDDAEPEQGEDEEEAVDEEQDAEAEVAPVARSEPGIVPRVLAESRANYIARASTPAAPPPRPEPAAPPRRLDRERLEAVLNELLTARQMLDVAMKDGG
ncbi:MAG: MerR family transcriptional regulator [Tardiphaga sp.]